MNFFGPKNIKTDSDEFNVLESSYQKGYLYLVALESLKTGKFYCCYYKENYESLVYFDEADTKDEILRAYYQRMNTVI